MLRNEPWVTQQGHPAHHLKDAATPTSRLFRDRSRRPRKAGPRVRGPVELRAHGPDSADGAVSVHIANRHGGLSLRGYEHLVLPELHGVQERGPTRSRSTEDPA
jgi:hypothetical protein